MKKLANEDRRRAIFTESLYKFGQFEFRYEGNFFLTPFLPYQDRDETHHF